MEAINQNVVGIRDWESIGFTDGDIYILRVTLVVFENHLIGFVLIEKSIKLEFKVYLNKCIIKKPISSYCFVYKQVGSQPISHLLDRSGSVILLRGIHVGRNMLLAPQTIFRWPSLTRKLFAPVRGIPCLQ